MTSTQLQDYIDSHIRPNGKKEITGAQLNYLMSNFLGYVDDEIGGAENLGNSNLALSTTGNRDVSFASSLSSNKIRFRNSAGTSSVMEVWGNGEVHFAGMGLIGAGTKKLKLGGDTSSDDFDIVNNSSSSICRFKGNRQVEMDQGYLTLGLTSGSATYAQLYFKSGSTSGGLVFYNGSMDYQVPNYFRIQAGSLIAQFGVNQMYLYDGKNIAFGQTTGGKIGTDPSEKIGFWGKTPVAQQILATGAGATADDIITFLQTIGLCKQS